MHGSAMSSADFASAWLLVVLCAVSGAYCLRQVRRSGGAAAGETVMAFGMALMAVPLGDRDGWQALVLGAVFSGAALHAVWLLRGGVHHAHHLVGSLAMAYMALTTAAGYGHGGGCPWSPDCCCSTTRGTSCWAGPGWSRRAAAARKGRTRWRRPSRPS